MQHVFTGTGGSLPSRFETSNSEGEVFVFVGEDGAEDFGGGTLKVQKLSESGNLITLTEITTFEDNEDRSMRFILPANQLVDVTLSSATAANLAVELQSGPRRNP